MYSLVKKLKKCGTSGEVKSVCRTFLSTSNTNEILNVNKLAMLLINNDNNNYKWLIGLHGKFANDVHSSAILYEAGKTGDPRIIDACVNWINKYLVNYQNMVTVFDINIRRGMIYLHPDLRLDNMSVSLELRDYITNGNVDDYYQVVGSIITSHQNKMFDSLGSKDLEEANDNLDRQMRYNFYHVACWSKNDYVLEFFNNSNYHCSRDDTIAAVGYICLDDLDSLSSTRRVSELMVRATFDSVFDHLTPNGLKIFEFVLNLIPRSKSDERLELIKYYIVSILIKMSRYQQNFIIDRIYSVLQILIKYVDIYFSGHSVLARVAHFIIRDVNELLFFVESFNFTPQSLVTLYTSCGHLFRVDDRQETLTTLHLRGHDLAKLSKKYPLKFAAFTLSTYDFNLTIKIVDTMRVELSKCLVNVNVLINPILSFL